MNSVIKFYVSNFFFIYICLTNKLYDLGNEFRNTTRAYVPKQFNFLLAL